MKILLHRRAWLAAAASLPLVAGLSACDQAKQAVGLAPPSFKAIDITGAEYAKGFDLPDVDGRRRTLADFKGKVVVMFFGYTQCPDVCPTTMAELAQVRRTLGEAGKDLQGIFVTLDPERDTPELLKAYLDNFEAGFVGLRGTPEETKATAQHYKVFFSRVNGKTPTSYTIDHTAGSYIYDRQGRLRLFSRYGSSADDLTADLRRLLQ